MDVVLAADDDKHDLSRGFDRRCVCFGALAPLYSPLPGTDNMPKTVKRPLCDVPVTSTRLVPCLTIFFFYFLGHVSPPVSVEGIVAGYWPWLRCD